MPFSQPVTLDQLVQTGSTVTIEELSATTAGGKPRRVVLVGPAQPLKGGAKWGGSSRLVTSWYAGNSEASQQNMGPDESPSDWNGEWNRTRMGRAPTVYYDEAGTQRGIVDPLELYEILDSIRIAGARCRVTWAVRGRRLLGSVDSGTDEEVDKQIIREGRMKSLEIQPDTEVDIKWTMNWEWVSRGGSQQKVANVRSDEDLAQATNAVSQSINALDFYVDTRMVSLKAAKRLSANNLTLGQLEAMANAPLKAVDAAMKKLRYNVNQFKRAVDVTRKLALAPVAMANSVLDFARNTQAIANQFVAEIGRTPPELLSNKQKVSDLARSAKYYGGIQQQMQATSRAAADLINQLRLAVVSGANRGVVSVRESSTTRAGDLIAIHVCKTGDTPTRLSSKYYGNPDQGPEILRANRLPSHTPTFRPGAIVVVPALVGAPRPQ